MVKCKDGAYVCAEQHEEVVEYLRKKAENSPGQSPHEAVIQEQDEQIAALKRDLLEKTAELRKKAIEAVYDLNQIGGLQEENARLKAECQARQAENSVLAVECDSLKAEVEMWKLRSYNWQKFCQLTRPDMTDEVTRLKAEVERLKAFTTRTIIPNEELQAQVERLTEAGDEMAAVIIQYRCSPWGRKVPSAFTVWNAWHAAKKGGQP